MKKVQKHWIKGLFLWISNILGILIFIPFLLILIANQLIRVSSEEYLYDTIEFIPHNKVGLVLGTSHRMRDGGPNPYFFNRMEAAAELYHHGKVNYIIASGDNRTRWYNEPEQMRKELTRLGVPDSVIYLDYAGLRTLDSVIRCKKVFGQNSFTIISQKFHNERAVYIAKHHDLDVVAFNASDIENNQHSSIMIREWFAKVNVFMDQITKKQPRYTGERVIIGD
jgi:SanA protein